MAETRPAARPLSPHLQIFRPMITMVMSIVHRVTGAGLYFGMALLVWWLAAAAVSDAQFALVQGLFGSWFGLLLLLGFSWALIHHGIGGLRHLMWDMGYGLSLDVIDKLAWGNLIASIALTVLLWIVGLWAAA